MNDLSNMQLLHGSVPKQLHWADRDSMAHSVECRVPFLDHRLVEFVVGLPEKLRICEGTTKVVLRNAMKGILPEKISNRVDKMGFVSPLEHWIQQEDPERFRKLVREAVDQSKGVIKEDIHQIADDIISGKARYDKVVWRVICFGKWMEKFSLDL